MVRESEPWQWQRINTLIAKLGIEDCKGDILAGYKAKSTQGLSYHHARELIDLLTDRAVAAGVWIDSRKKNAPRSSRTKFAKPGTLSTLRYYAIACGIHYTEWGRYTTESGEVLEGNEVRDYLRRRFNLGRLEDENLRVKLLIPKVLFTRMHNDWINVKCNTFLLEGGYRVEIKNLSQFFYDSITEKEAQYLINRFRGMWGVLEKQIGEVAFPLITSVHQIGAPGCVSNN